MNTPDTAEKYEAFVAADDESPPTIQFNFDTGNACALPYADLAAVEFNRSGMITIEFSSRKVILTGRRLDDLFASLVRYQVISVRQHAMTDARPPSGECCVDEMVIVENE